MNKKPNGKYKGVTVRSEFFPSKRASEKKQKRRNMKDTP